MATSTHYDEVRRILIARLGELVKQIQGRLREARTDASGRTYLVEAGETTEVHPEDELGFALLQMKGQVLNRINEAMRRLDEGTYGYCGECGGAITVARLRALPFAVRCKDCEEMREHSEERGRASHGEWRLA